jgi:N-acyl homoserine lactone hydrolase
MKLYLLQTAIYADGDARAPFPAYLIQTDEGKNVLVDTGVDEGYVTRTVNANGERVIIRQEAEKLPHQLAGLGLQPADIHYVVSTHFDEDHCGGNPLFSHAEFIVQRSHYELARSGRERRFEICRAAWDAPELNYRLVDGDIELLPGIELLVTDGHVTGHQSVLVRLPNTGAVLLAIDAIRDGDMLLPGVDPRARSMFDMDGDKLLEGVTNFGPLLNANQLPSPSLGTTGNAGCHCAKRQPTTTRSCLTIHSATQPPLQY